mmetsp:Transcript_3902/g.16216  ORF Transcript_3902/g.16216 Transcript_3902/m.16216 type:complete len:311 (+) Transcript_3902:564-1496(+)
MLRGGAPGCAVVVLVILVVVDDTLVHKLVQGAEVRLDGAAGPGGHRLRAAPGGGRGLHLLPAWLAGAATVRHIASREASVARGHGVRRLPAGSLRSVPGGGHGVALARPRHVGRCAAFAAEGSCRASADRRGRHFVDRRKSKGVGAGSCRRTGRLKGRGGAAAPRAAPGEGAPRATRQHPGLAGRRYRSGPPLRCRPWPNVLARLGPCLGMHRRAVVVSILDAGRSRQSHHPASPAAHALAPHAHGRALRPVVPRRGRTVDAQARGLVRGLLLLQNVPQVLHRTVVAACPLSLDRAVCPVRDGTHLASGA